MIVQAIYHNGESFHRVYHAGEIMFEEDPFVFQMRKDGKLIILGAYSAVSKPDGLYLDCDVEDPVEPEEPVEPDPTEPEEPTGEWIYPVRSGNLLELRQVYNATKKGNMLEVE